MKKEMKQVRCGEDVKKIDQRDKGGRGKIPLGKSPRLPKRGQKSGKKMIIRPFNYISTDTQSKILHSVRLDISRRTADEPLTQSKIHLLLFIQITLHLTKLIRTFF